MFREIRTTEKINDVVDRKRERLLFRTVDTLIGTQAHHDAVMAVREYDILNGINSIFSAEDFVEPTVLF